MPDLTKCDYCGHCASMHDTKARESHRCRGVVTLDTITYEPCICRRTREEVEGG